MRKMCDSSKTRPTASLTRSAVANSARSVERPAFGDADPVAWTGRAPHVYPVHGIDVSRYQGAIDWPGTVMAFEKIGYDGVFMFEIKNQQSAAATLERAVRARQRLESLAGSLELEAGSW